MDGTLIVRRKESHSNNLSNHTQCGEFSNGDLSNFRTALTNDLERLHNSCSAYLNLHAFGPTKGIINGELGEWHFNKEAIKSNEIISTFWSEAESKLRLGDFKALVEFLLASSGKQEHQEMVT